MQKTFALVFIALISSSFGEYYTETWYVSDTACSGEVIYSRTVADANPICVQNSFALYSSVTCDVGTAVTSLGNSFELFR